MKFWLSLFKKLRLTIAFLPYCLCSVNCSKNLNIVSCNDKVSDLIFSDLPVALDHYHLPLLVEPFVI